MSLRGVLRRGRALPILAALAWPGVASAGLVVTIQPNQVCDTGGTGCAMLPDFSDPATPFAAFGNAIFAKAGLALEFRAPTTLDDSAVNRFTYSDAAWTALAGRFDMAAEHALPVYFLTSIIAGSAVNYGLGSISMVMVANAASAAARWDSMAHELGHALTLPHATYSNAALMREGAYRTIPTTLAQAGVGGSLSLLSPGELASIATACATGGKSALFCTDPDRPLFDSGPGVPQAVVLPFQEVDVPEPASLVLLGAGLLGLGLLRRRG